MDDFRFNEKFVIRRLLCDFEDQILLRKRDGALLQEEWLVYERVVKGDSPL